MLPLGVGNGSQSCQFFDWLLLRGVVVHTLHQDIVTRANGAIVNVKSQLSDKFLLLIAMLAVAPAHVDMLCIYGMYLYAQATRADHSNVFRRAVERGFEIDTEKTLENRLFVSIGT